MGLYHCLILPGETLCGSVPLSHFAWIDIVWVAVALSHFAWRDIVWVAVALSHFTWIDIVWVAVALSPFAWIDILCVCSTVSVNHILYVCANTRYRIYRCCVCGCNLSVYMESVRVGPGTSAHSDTVDLHIPPPPIRETSLWSYEHQDAVQN